jgi:hypothetical protein
LVGVTSFGIRATVSIAVRNKAQGLTRVRYYQDILAFVTGPAEINVMVLSVSQPPSSATERRLLSLLYGRSKA